MCESTRMSVISAVLLCSLQAYGRQGDEVHPEYLKAVRCYADAMIKDGRDTCGREKSPVFIAGGLDLKTHAFVRRQLKGQGIREGDRAYGANPHHDLNFYQTLYALTELTGDKKYAQQADKALKWFFQNCRSPATELFAWGEHLHWDVVAEQCKGRDLHEFYRPWVLWDRSFDVAPKACEAFARGLWDHQIYNHSGDFNRHAKWSEHGPGRRCNISRHAGFYIATWGHAYDRTKDPVFLKAIERVLIFKEASRHPITNFLPSDRNANSVNQWLSDIIGEEVKLSHDPRIGGLHSHVAGTLSLAIDLHDAAKYIDGELKQMMTDFAHTEDEHFLKFHEGLGENSEHLFVDCGGVSTMKPFETGRSYAATAGGRNQKRLSPADCRLRQPVSEEQPTRRGHSKTGHYRRCHYADDRRLRVFRQPEISSPGRLHRSPRHGQLSRYLAAASRRRRL
ncbi:MAG: hypothetical protein ACYTEQ_22960 [Planctomycetota bacterium]